MAAFLLVSLLGVATGAEARQGGEISGPTITLNPTSVRPGENTAVIFTGWQGRLVTLSVCGNAARRGSVDCNLPASLGVRLSHVDESPVSDFLVSAPPGTCPCVIRASSVETSEVATAPIEIIGHPFGPVVGPTHAPPLEVALDVKAASQGIGNGLRRALGGSIPYEVTVTVRNPTGRAYRNVSVSGSVGRSRTVDVAGFDMEPFAIRAGQTWTATTKLTLPTPALGSYVWQATASGAGPVVTAEQTTETFPWLAAVLIVLFLLTVGAMVVRRVRRRRRRTRTAEDDLDTAVPRSIVLPGSSGG